MFRYSRCHFALNIFAMFSTIRYSIQHLQYSSRIEFKCSKCIMKNKNNINNKSSKIYCKPMIKYVLSNDQDKGNEVHTL